MSDERDSAGSAGEGTGDTDATNGGGDVDQTAGKAVAPTAVASRPQRPTGKRTRREVTGNGNGSSSAPATDAGAVKNGDGKKRKTAKKDGPSRNPIAFVINYLKQVVAELRKVIWPNRKQMVSYTTVVLIFLAFMVALIGGVDLGFAKLIALALG